MLVGLDAAGQTLLFFAASPDARRDIGLPLPALRRAGAVTLRTDLSDAHCYVFDRVPLLAALEARPAHASLKQVGLQRKHNVRTSLQKNVHVEDSWGQDEITKWEMRQCCALTFVDVQCIRSAVAAGGARGAPCALLPRIGGFWKSRTAKTSGIRLCTFFRQTNR